MNEANDREKLDYSHLQKSVRESRGPKFLETKIIHPKEFYIMAP